MTQGRRVSLHAYLSVSLFTIVSIWVSRGSYSSANQKPAPVCIDQWEAGAISPAWGLRVFTIDTDKTQLARKSKGAAHLFIFITGKYIYKGTSLSGEKKWKKCVVRLLPPDMRFHWSLKIYKRRFTQALDKWVPQQFFSALSEKLLKSAFVFTALYKLRWPEAKCL